MDKHVYNEASLIKSFVMYMYVYKKKQMTFYAVVSTEILAEEKNISGFE